MLFRSQKEITTDLASVLVPSMILQPIVENAIKYGVSGIEWDAKVSIYVSLEEDTVCVIVRDNGVGISEDVIAGIFRESTRIDTEQGIEQSNGVGLRNVRARMQLYYGRDDVMDITSGGDNMGTEVALKIPLRGK